MNEVQKAIAERNSCRDFVGIPLTDVQVKAIVDAALAAPSAMNRQPWHVSIVTNKAFVDEMDSEGMNVLAAAADKSGYERIQSRGGKLFYNAPCMVVVSNDGSGYASIDCGILCQNIALAAHSLGLGSVIVGMVSVPLSGERGDEFKEKLSLPEGYEVCIAVLVGAANKGKAPHELDYNKVSYLG